MSRPTEKTYARFRRIDGRHPFQQQVPNGYILYPARRRSGGTVTYFNFALAKEMGLLPRSHPHQMNPTLQRVILDCFAIVIVNEYDQQHHQFTDPKTWLPHPYMATRYLQIQHPNKRGRTSGDGRSLWNGTFSSRGQQWDISSCGTGVTRLCPATAQTGEFYPTGSDAADYGCGTASLEEGIGGALMSEILHRHQVPTERVLALIEFPHGQAIHVRAHPNLLRPSHLFVPMKQGDIVGVRQIADYTIQRECQAGRWPKLTGPARDRHFAEQLTRNLARAAACFESEYLFVWLDWDGDNILIDGSIIDYGSVRQFGLFHRDYRFDDGPRWSTTLAEQQHKTKQLAQTFAQIEDCLLHQRKRPLAAFQNTRLKKVFDSEFLEHRQRLLLANVGLPTAIADRLRQEEPVLVADYQRIHRRIERARSSFGLEYVPDGITWNAIYCVRDLLRELPRRWQQQQQVLSASEFYEIALSKYATKQDRELTPGKERNAALFQRAYRRLLQAAARLTGKSLLPLLETLVPRSDQINRVDRCTGDSLTHATRVILQAKPKLTRREFQAVMEQFIRSQDRHPDGGHDGDDQVVMRWSPQARAVLEQLDLLQHSYCHSI